MSDEVRTVRSPEGLLMETIAGNANRWRVTVDGESFEAELLGWHQPTRASDVCSVLFLLDDGQRVEYQRPT